MPKVTFKACDGTTTTVDIPVGWSVMEGAIQKDIDGIVAECGGGCACATCHVFVDTAWFDQLPARSDNENDMLDCTATERRPNSRLSCQIKLTTTLDGMIVELPEAQT